MALEDSERQRGTVNSRPGQSNGSAVSEQAEKPSVSKRSPQVDRFNQRLADDRSRIDLSRRHEVRHWTKKWGVSEQELQEAVAKVGPSIRTLDNELGKRASQRQEPEREPKSA